MIHIIKIYKLLCFKKLTHTYYIVRTLNFRSTIDYLFKTYENINNYYILYNR